METPKRGGCYKQLPNGTLLPVVHLAPGQVPAAEPLLPDPAPDTPPPTPPDWHFSIPDDDPVGPGFDTDQPQED